MNLVPRLAILTLLILAPALSAEPRVDASALGFLAGDWRGTLPNGRIAEEHFTAPEGGVLLAVGREFQDGRCVFYDLVVFSEEKGGLVLTPHPLGRRSSDTFPLVDFDAGASRAVFENPAHDFPKRFVYELAAPDLLRITLSGEQKGTPATEVYELRRVARP